MEEKCVEQGCFTQLYWRFPVMTGNDEKGNKTISNVGFSEK